MNDRPTVGLGRIGLGSAIDSVDEFNRRWAKAARGITFLPGSWDKRFAQTMIALIERGEVPTDKAQAQLYRIAHTYRRQISDSLVTDYAATRAKGADS